ncbi:autophagy protein atg9 [Arachnomyces sp. PD_36]|nr:autophagy protein atg9 [Arachnomyces sp. PD_36]
MASNILSRFLPPGSPSVYETLRQNDAASDASDIEERAGMAVDEENLGGRFQDYELEDALADASDSQMTTQSTAFLGQEHPRRPPGGRLDRRRSKGKSTRPKWMGNSPRVTEADEGDDEVPASLLVEGDDDEDDTTPPAPPAHPNAREPSPMSSPGDTRRPRWEGGRSIHPRHSISQVGRSPRGDDNGRGPNLAFADPKEKAMWRWTNVENLDNFLKDVYIYFIGNGIWCIFLSRILNLLTLAFVVGFTTFLTSCINYHKVPDSKKLDEIIIPRCTKKMSTSSTLLLWLFTLIWIGKLVQYIFDIRRLRHMHDFYHYLLGVSDSDIQTISWQEVVSRLMTLRDSNPTTTGALTTKQRAFIGTQSKQRMDAHDIANRLMRKENYLIALFNKDILDLTLPIPFLRNRQLFSRTLEWNINLCILDFVFNDQGQVRPMFLKDIHRKALSEGLRRRFIVAGILNIFAAPFIVTYFLMHYFFRYFNEYQKNPSQIGSRQYTPLAEWKFREFNELWHLFQRRINMSYPFSTRYIDQFPKDKAVQVSRFVAFVAGALASVLALASVVDPELFLGFEITHDRTVLFYLGLFGTIYAVARGLVPEETFVFDPEFALHEVINFTHYRPAHWTGRLHSDDVKREFAMLYQMKVVIFLEEILSMLFTPFVLWFSLPKCSDRLIDFFREFTVHVDGVGYVCSFAVFDFKKGTNAMTQDQNLQPGGGNGQQDLRNDYFSTKDGKMLASYYGFLDNYATNPRPGAPYIHSPAHNRRYNPPPPPPGLKTPGITDEFNTPRPTGRHSQIGMHPPGRFPATAAGVGHNSPVQSMLLDPHHQPSASGFRSVHRPTTAQSRYRPARHPLTDTIRDEDEEEEDDDNSPRRGAGMTATRNITAESSGGVTTDGSNLEESWKMKFAGDVDSDEDGGRDGEEDVKAVVEGAGVLGLIHQFQKVSNEGRGVGNM